MTSATAKMNSQGRVSIPASIRHELDIRPETDLVCYEECGRVVFEERKHLLHRLQRHAAQARRDSTSVSDELIAERREAAAHERSQMET